MRNRNEGFQKFMMMRGLTFISLFNASSYKEREEVMAKQNAEYQTNNNEQMSADKNRKLQQAPTHSKHDNQHPQHCSPYFRSKR